MQNARHFCPTSPDTPLKIGRSRVQEVGHGAAQQNVSTSEIEAVTIALPNQVHEQRRIAREFEAFHVETQRLESLYQQKLAALDALKKSLLHQAFSGQLTS
jgi:type I restriction enzyme S subunit